MTVSETIGVSILAPSNICSCSGETFGDPSQLFQYVNRDDVSDPAKPKYFCMICHKFSHQARANVRNHVEARHFPNSFSYSCDLCGKECPSKSTLQLHRSRVHKPNNSSISVTDVL